MRAVTALNADAIPPERKSTAAINCTAYAGYDRTIVAESGTSVRRARDDECQK